MAKANGTKSLDLGAMQDEVELSTKALKAARTVAERANNALMDAEERYAQANKALINGVNTLRGATKMPL